MRMWSKAVGFFGEPELAEMLAALVASLQSTDV
jgi:hypothetical protein